MDFMEDAKKNRDDRFKELIALAAVTNPTKARKLAEYIEEADAFIRPVDRQLRGKYIACKRPIDAIKALFGEDEHPRPLTEQEIKDLIVNKGGYRRGDPPSIPFTRMTVQKALKAHLPGHAGHANFALKFVNGKYGLEEWDDAKFEQN